MSLIGGAFKLHFLQDVFLLSELSLNLLNRPSVAVEVNKLSQVQIFCLKLLYDRLWLCEFLLVFFPRKTKYAVEGGDFVFQGEVLGGKEGDIWL